MGNLGLRRRHPHADAGRSCARVRKKLGAYADQYIETIFGIGYRFQPFRIIRPRQESAQDPVAGVA